MKNVYKFVAGNSRITPAGIVLALAAALAFNTYLRGWAAPVYLCILLATLAAAVMEPVQ
jgi:hypothetical protein